MRMNRVNYYETVRRGTVSMSESAVRVTAGVLSIGATFTVGREIFLFVLATFQAMASVILLLGTEELYVQSRHKVKVQIDPCGIRLRDEIMSKCPD